MKIKKLLCAALAAMSVVPTVSAFAATEDPVEFSTVDEMNGQVYVAQYFSTQQGLYFKGANVTTRSIPYSALKFSTTQFCCYGNRFYYMNMEPCDGISKIYSCDANGNDEIMIANNASAGSSAFIVDNNIYYNAYSSVLDWTGNYFGREYYGGIYKINLATGDWQRLVTDSDASMWFCDGDYIYYSAGDSYYQIDTNGNYCHYANSYGDEFAWNSYSYNLSSYVLTGRTMYFTDNTGTLYSKARKGSDLEQLKRIVGSPMGSYVIKVTKKYIYYTARWPEDPFVWLYRTDRY